MFETIGYSMLALGASLIVLALIFTVVWRVPSLIDELSGRKAKRQIERMKKLNIASSNLNGMDTSEFYKSMRSGYSIPEEGNIPSTMRINGGSELSKLVDDPNIVGVSKKSKKHNADVVVVDEEAGTAFCEDNGIPKKLKIRVISEQSSIF